MVSIKTPLRFFEAVFLDILFIPGKIMGKKGNALWHLNIVCPRCSKWRKKFRDPNKQGDLCLWECAWTKKDYSFSRDFGILNWIKYYFGMDTNLKRYAK
jgi:hypothetical protein